MYNCNTDSLGLILGVEVFFSEGHCSGALWSHFGSQSVDTVNCYVLLHSCIHWVLIIWCVSTSIFCLHHLHCLCIFEASPLTSHPEHWVRQRRMRWGDGHNNAGHYAALQHSAALHNTCCCMAPGDTSAPVLCCCNSPADRVIIGG